MGGLSHSCNGSLRGIIVAWAKNLGAIHFMHTNRQLALGVISISNEPTWILGVIYASTSAFDRCQVWSQVQVVLALETPLLIAGDFNCILHSEDKRGGKPFRVDRAVHEFRSFLRTSGLIDLGFRGPKFTWCNNCLGQARVWERIDRVFASLVGWMFILNPAFII